MNSKTFSISQIIVVLSSLIIVSSLILPSFSFGQENTSSGPQLPETMEEVKAKGEEFGKEVQKQLPGILKKSWQTEVRPIWEKMWNWFKGWWQNTAFPWVESIFQKKVKPEIERKIESKKSEIKERFGEEKEEMKKSILDRFKELLK